MRKRDRIKYIRKYGKIGKVVFYRNPAEFNLATVKREYENGNIILYAQLKKKKKSVRVMKIILRRSVKDTLREIRDDYNEYVRNDD